MLHSEAPHALLNPSTWFVNFPNPSGASWLCFTETGACDTREAQLTTYHKYTSLCIMHAQMFDHTNTEWFKDRDAETSSCMHTHIYIVYKSQETLTEWSNSKYWILSYFQIFNTALQLCHFMFHSFKHSCQTPYGDNLPLAISEFSAMLYITKACLPRGFLTFECHTFILVLWSYYKLRYKYYSNTKAIPV